MTELKRCSYHHWDCDGVVSKIFHDRIYGKCYSKASGYGKIDKILNELVSKGYQSITFTDLAITPVQMQFCVDNFEEVRFFDHHPATEETYALFKDHPKVKECVFRSDLSGAGIMYVEYLRKGGVNSPELARLAKWADDYDLWKQDSPNWKESFELNDLFWIYSFFAFEKRFINGIDKFTDNEIQMISDKRKEIEAILDKSPIEELEGSGFIIMPTDRGTISHLTFMIPDYIFYYIISFDDGTNTYSASLRMNNVDRLLVEPDINEKLKSIVDDNQYITSAGGHAQAAGISFTEGITVPKILEVIKNDIHPLMDTRLK